jgi:hypothetical protein
MSWTYDLSTNTGKVRYWAGDTDSSDQLATDEEIAYALSLTTDVKSAAAMVLDQLAAKWGRKADSSVGDLQISYSQASKRFEELARRLRTFGISPIPVAGGTSVSRIEEVEEDEDVPDPGFKVGMLDNKRAFGSMNGIDDEEHD